MEVFELAHKGQTGFESRVVGDIRHQGMDHELSTIVAIQVLWVFLDQIGDVIPTL